MYTKESPFNSHLATQTNMKNGFRLKETHQKDAADKSSGIPKYYDWLNSKPGNKLIETIQQENQLLKEEIESLSSYLNNSLEIFDQLSAENKQVKILLIQKDQDLRKAVETLQINESENLEDCQLQIQLLQEEVSLLSQQIEKLSDENKKQDEKIQLLRQEHEKQSLSLEMSLQREQQLVHEQEFQKQTLQTFSQDNQNHLQLIQDLQDKLKESNLQNQSLKTEVEEMRRKLFQDANQDRSQTIKLQNSVEQLQNDNQTLTFQNKKSQEQLQNLRAEFYLMKKQKDELESSLYHRIEENNKVLDQLKLEQNRRQQSLNRESKMGSDLGDARNQILKLKNQMQLEQRKFKEEEEKIKQQIENINNTNDKQQESNKQKYSREIQDRQSHINQLESQYKSLQTQYEKSEQERTNLEQNIQNLRYSNSEYEKLKKISNELSSQLKEKLLENDSLQVQLEEYRMFVQENSSEHKKKIIQQQEQLDNLQNENDSLQRKNEQLELMKQPNWAKDDIKRENSDLRRQIEEQQKLYKDLKEHYEESELELVNLKAQNNQLQQLIELSDKKDINPLKEDKEIFRQQIPRTSAQTTASYYSPPSDIKKFSSVQSASSLKSGFNPNVYIQSQAQLKIKPSLLSPNSYQSLPRQENNQPYTKSFRK